jgi:hypothetical protein
MIAVILRRWGAKRRREKPEKIEAKEGAMADMAVEPQMGLTFEQVWAALMETRASIHELREDGKETDRRMKETDRLIHELREDGKETDRRMKELQKSMGLEPQMESTFEQVWAALMESEHLGGAPNIMKKFNELGCHFNDVAQDCELYNEETGAVEAEFYIIMESGEFVIGVDVKTKPAERDVSEHIERLECLRRHRDKLGDKREVRGAIAWAIMSRSVREAALREGLYVIEQSGDTVRIEEPKNARGWRGECSSSGGSAGLFVSSP